MNDEPWHKVTSWGNLGRGSVRHTAQLEEGDPFNGVACWHCARSSLFWHSLCSARNPASSKGTATVREAKDGIEPRAARAGGSFPRTRGDVVSSLLLVLAAVFAAYLVLVQYPRYAALFFCSILGAVALVGVARLLNARNWFSHSAAVVVTLGLLLILGMGAAWWIGPKLVTQFDALREQVPRGLEEARRAVESTTLGRTIAAEAPPLKDAVPSPGTVAKNVGLVVGAGFAALADLAIGLFIAIFLAVSPSRYFTGATNLLPSQHRQRGNGVLRAMGAALRRWLLARGALMLLVATLMGVGLLIIGVPLALPLALLAGAFSFVPYVGPILAFIPAVAMGLLESPMHALYVALLYLGVQLLESYVVEPLVEAHAVSLPPALIIVAQVMAAVWLGPIGVVIATPLLVVVAVAVQMLYLQDVLKEEVQVIGE